ncbi:MAG: ribonuclease P protein component [Candidatus Ryanbacteria bacterium RIFCSPHIGHO2_02_FULL_45_43]|uniref:Ribonuclease P protein component n=1 Tax=Candidatus Ryanbacteria bacterium RIFCSPHIGHO2_01_45_13 TaxID=1802112 RepID=A0A1G2FZ14_9BACT|nr:MAG: ribonuclease P protein component [Candidatus Ryanbacteria bacterium RIFCSPHIGHO2_01_FULL_44_130]OGZ43313.1 MAG: ribonuclease P protein component [Candidatus Ryanbacteria bacterium RIFCSPHIGHO2_01_45_13]OGZ48221.1 MAG: ribonuclease P protein component [Candidatus Ryanbacteria bacterium RIFCSPHIGHO2_02_FULL_45_43]OGZ49997.1 MAG: ribonuclease P protein component [Candidatus Ryanbacteria bacterium RIFCSPHIGHO2_12_FULL_44_20]OGZ51456.1 MAG: ribonuclease P protein component [Candidatus Ryanba
MLPAASRLKNPKQYKLVLKKGRKAQTFFFVAQALPTKRAGEPQIGVVVSKTVSRKTIERNAVKRKTREVLRLFVVPFMGPGYDVVIRALPLSNGASFAQIKKDVIFLIRKLQLLP